MIKYRKFLVIFAILGGILASISDRFLGEDHIVSEIAEQVVNVLSAAGFGNPASTPMSHDALHEVIKREAIEEIRNLPAVKNEATLISQVVNVAEQALIEKRSNS